MAFDTEKQLKEVDSSTFDIVQVETFHNTRFSTVFWFLWLWILLFLQTTILAMDCYTCINILAFHKWSSSEYQPYQYHVAKWIFTGCILFRFVLIAYQVAWGIHTYRTRNIALAYLNNVAKLMYLIRSYDYHCLFNEIEPTGSFQWSSFFVYRELDNALEVLVADLPRQVINVMTIVFYATGGLWHTNVLTNIEKIATTNLRLAVILSFMLVSACIFLFFFFSFVLGMVLYIPIRVKVSHRGFKLLKLYCYKAVNDQVRALVSRHHKPRAQILNEGLMDLLELQANSLLSGSTLDFGDNYRKLSHYESSIRLADLGAGTVEADLKRPFRAHTASSLRENPFADNLSSHPFLTSTESLSQVNPVNPFAAPRKRPSDLFEQPSSIRDGLRNASVGLAKSVLASVRKDSFGLTSHSVGDTSTVLATNTFDLGYHSDPPPVTPLLVQHQTVDPFSDDESEHSGDPYNAPYPVRGDGDDASEHSGAPYPVRGVSMYGPN